MTNNKELAERMYAFLEKIECSGNSDVAEVVEFTVLEELCDEYRDSELEVYLQPETKLALKAISKVYARTAMKYRKKPIVVDAYQTDQPTDIKTLEGTTAEKYMQMSI